jgi:hypothetical protein
MKNVVLWDIKTQFVLHRRHITSPLQNPACWCYVRFDVFTAVTMKNAISWDVRCEESTFFPCQFDGSFWWSQGVPKRCGEQKNFELKGIERRSPGPFSVAIQIVKLLKSWYWRSISSKTVNLSRTWNHFANQSKGIVLMKHYRRPAIMYECTNRFDFAVR